MNSIRTLQLTLKSHSLRDSILQTRSSCEWELSIWKYGLPILSPRVLSKCILSWFQGVAYILGHKAFPSDFSAPFLVPSCCKYLHAPLSRSHSDIPTYRLGHRLRHPKATPCTHHSACRVSSDTRISQLVNLLRTLICYLFWATDRRIGLVVSLQTVQREWNKKPMIQIYGSSSTVKRRIGSLMHFSLLYFYLRSKQTSRQTSWWLVVENLIISRWERCVRSKHSWRPWSVTIFQRRSACTDVVLVPGIKSSTSHDYQVRPLLTRGQWVLRRRS